MATLSLEPTATAQWLKLVKAAEFFNHHFLPEDLESYLVFLLMRFSAQPELAASVLALDYLHAFNGTVGRATKLQEVGDKCLLLAGLFPERADRKHVQISYFVKLGQGAYAAAAEFYKNDRSELYEALCADFVGLMDILHAAREIGGQRLTPLQAESLWRDVQSPHALQVLRHYTKGVLFAASDSDAEFFSTQPATKKYC